MPTRNPGIFSQEPRRWRTLRKILWVAYPFGFGTGGPFLVCKLVAWVIFICRTRNDETLRFESIHKSK